MSRINQLRPIWSSLRIWQFLAGISVGLFVFSMVLNAAPMLSRRQTSSSDVIRSLANIDRLRIAVDVVPEFVGAGITIEEVERHLQRELEKSGIEIVGEGGANVPTLLVRAYVVTDDQVPDGITFAYYLRLYQDVHVERLQKRLVVPTFRLMLLHLEHRDAFADQAIKALDQIVDQFIAAVGSASEVR